MFCRFVCLDVDFRGAAAASCLAPDVAAKHLLYSSPRITSARLDCEFTLCGIIMTSVQPALFVGIATTSRLAGTLPAEHRRTLQYPPHACARVCSYHSSIPSTQSPSWTGIDKLEGGEGLFHMPDDIHETALEGQDLAIMDVAGSKPPKPELVAQYLSKVRMNRIQMSSHCTAVLTSLKF
jgi:hypothetical protein